jgi:hypothetical protein
MTNWKNAFDNPFLGAYDLDGAVQLTIDRVEQKMVQLIKMELKNVAYFKEAKLPSGRVLKPMILNVSNCKKIHDALNSGEMETWNNVKIELSVKPNKGRIGEKFGLSINRVISVGEGSAPVNAKTELTPESPNWAGVIEYVKSNKQLGLANIINNLQSKYTISTATKKELGNYVD